MATRETLFSSATKQELLCLPCGQIWNWFVSVDEASVEDHLRAHGHHRLDRPAGIGGCQLGREVLITK